MEFFSRIDDLPELHDCVVTLGSFDGLHYGHKHLIRQVQDRAAAREVPAVLITFHPHPKEVLLRNREIPVELLTTTDEKKAILRREFDLDYVLVLPFTVEFSQIPARQFLEQFLIEPFDPSEIVIGYDHTFGKSREGDEAFLRQHEGEFGYQTIRVDPIGLQDEAPVSSSGIRTLIAEGDMLRAARYLTRPYMVTGKVVRGERRGHDLNFPTANIQPENHNKLIPRDGVYLVYVTDGIAPSYGMCNVGYRPTFPDHQHVIEVNLFELGNVRLYGYTLHVHFFHYLREEKKFQSPDDLAAQLASDKEQCAALIAEQDPWKQYQKELVV